MPSVDRICGYYQPELEVMTGRKREKYQLALLKKTAANACVLSPGTRRLFAEAGLDPSAIKELAELAMLPLTRKRDLSSLQKKEPPFGGFTTVSPGSLARIYVSPGPIYDPEGTEEDFWNLRKALYAGGFRRGDIVQNTFAYHFTPAGMMFDHALRDLGCVVIPAGVGNTEMQVTTMRDLKVTGYVGMPSFLIAILEKAEEMGVDPRKEFCLDVAGVAAEILSSSLRKKLQGDFGLMVRQAYITADLGTIGFECSEADGLHVPEEVIVEIVNPATDEVIAEAPVAALEDVEQAVASAQEIPQGEG